MAISSSVHGTYLIDLVVLVVIIWRVSEPVEPTLLFMYRVLFFVYSHPYANLLSV